MNPNCPVEVHPFTNRWFNYNQPALTPEQQAAWITNQEKGYFGFLPNPQIKHLIIGSFPIWASVHHNPPHAGFDFAFFYCSRVNGFFKFMEVLTGLEFFPNQNGITPHQKANSVINFFLSKQIGITDIIFKVRRTDAKCKSNLDRDLHVTDFNNICQLITDYPSITHLYCTSNAVAEWINKVLKKCESVKNRINIHILFSPGRVAGPAAIGILNRDEREHGLNDSMRYHLTQIPLINNLAEVDGIRVAKWAKRLKNVPNLVLPEIIEHPNYIRIEPRPRL